MIAPEVIEITCELREALKAAVDKAVRERVDLHLEVTDEDRALFADDAAEGSTT